MNKNWQLLFERLDADKSGRLDYGEFVRAVREELRVTDTTEEELRALWTYVDHDRSGEVTIREFQHGCYLLILEGWPVLSKERVEAVVGIMNAAAKRWMMTGWVKVFRAMDTDASDGLGFEELEGVARANGTQGGLSLQRSDLADSELRGLWRALDGDCSGEVTIDEFMHFMRREEKKPEKPKTPEPPRRRVRRRAPSPNLSVRTQDTAATTPVASHVGDYLATSTTLRNVERETGCRLAVAHNEVTYTGSDFQIRAARAAIDAAASRLLPPLTPPPQNDDDDSTIAAVEKLPPVPRRTPKKRVHAPSASPYGQTACSPANRSSGMASGWWGDRPERHQAQHEYAKRTRNRKRHERRRRRREQKQADLKERGWRDVAKEAPLPKDDATIRRAALGAARRAMGPEVVAYSDWFPRAGDLDGSPDLFITRRPDCAERERAILWSDPARDSKTRERLSRSPTRRAEAEAMVIHAEPTRPDVYVDKRWVSHRDLPRRRRERSLSPLSREIEKVEPLSLYGLPARPPPAFC